LVRVSVFAALGTSTCWAPKLSDVGENVGFTRMPLPERGTVCGLLAAASVIVRVPVRVPVWLGVNTTLTTQFALGARLVPVHPSAERLKSPDGVTELICREKLFGLVSVTFLAAEGVPTSCCGNTSAVGEIVSFPAPGDAVAVGVAVAVEVAVEVGVFDAVAVEVAVAVAVGVAVAVAVSVAVAVAVAVDVGLNVTVGVAVAVSVAVGVAVGGRRNWAAMISPFCSISAEFLPDGDGSPCFKSMAVSILTNPRSPQPLAPGTAKVLSATSTPVLMSAFPPGPPVVVTGVLVGVSARFRTIGVASDPI
jgi:hypothetical protein